MGALISGLLLARPCTFVYVILSAYLNPSVATSAEILPPLPWINFWSALRLFFASRFLFFSVFGASIFLWAIVCTTEAAGVGALGATILAYFK